ncbi:MAG: TIGR02302 family protein [Hyphomicrobiales bacterium]|nr:TIGR02302 family protein [Hyphomicrobiales bacterium]
MSGGAPLARLLARARAALAFEGLWRAGSAAAAVLALFLAVSWLDVWRFVPPALRPFGVLAFVAAAGVLVWRERGALTPSRQAALSRIDADPAAAGAAQALADAPANGGDPQTEALWRAHQARMAQRLSRVSAPTPSPRMDRRDRYALRAAALLAALVAGVYAGADRTARLANAFYWKGGFALGAAPGARLDAWIDPPPYTGRAPIVLTQTELTKEIAAPVNSLVVVRSSRPGAIDAQISGALVEDEKKDPAQKDNVRRFALKGDASLTLPQGAVAIHAIPDLPPRIELTEQPHRNARGTLNLRHRTSDDYGVASAEARFADPQLDRAGPQSTHILGEPPRVALTLPAAPGGAGEGKSVIDLTEHPWAGARAQLTLAARDEAGQEGLSKPIEIYIPMRPFKKPLARALVEQRRNLVLDPDHRERVTQALDALMVEPELFGLSSGVYVGMRAARARIMLARDDAGLMDAADFLWAMALQIEDGDLSVAERDLRAAEKALRDALQRGASEEEIAKLTQELRAAMDKFLAEMERQAPKNPQSAENQRNGRSVTPDQLRNMLKQMEDAARSGDAETAQRLLDQLQSTLENLRNARRSQGKSQAQKDMERALDDLQQLAEEEQQLRDDTFRQQQERDEAEQKDGQRGGEQAQNEGEEQDGAQPGGDQGRPGEQRGKQQSAPGKGAGGQSQPGGAPGQSLERRQKQLRDKLDALQRKLDQYGQKPDALGKAGDAMKDAQGALGRGQGDKAVEAEGKALESLREGARKLADKMAQGEAGEGDEDGEGQAQAGAGEGGGKDPLGRESNSGRRNNPNARYDANGASPALRAQRVLEELRRRLADPERPREELDYLERLMRRY